MLRVIDVFQVGSLYSITLQGECDGVKNGTRLQTKDGRFMTVQSVAMINRAGGRLHSEITVLSTANQIPEGTEVEIA